MTCEELRDEYAAYALGCATEPERSEISAHLARNCPECTKGVRDAMLTTSSMAAAVKSVDPPRRLRRRIIALVSHEQGQSWAAALLPWGVAAALAMALMFAVLNTKDRGQNPRMTQALSILNDPATKDVSFGQPAARGRVFVSSGKGVVFIAAHLPTLQGGRTFELWVIPQKGAPIAAGTFDSDKDSSALYVRPGPVEDIAAVAVTVEPAGGSPAPTTKPFIVAKL